MIGQGGGLSPPVISAPGSVDIALTIVSGDGHAHHVQINAPGAPALAVAAGARASTVITGLKNGSYPIYVDGVRRGALVIGVSPGP